MVGLDLDGIWVLVSLTLGVTISQWLFGGSGFCSTGYYSGLLLLLSTSSLAEEIVDLANTGPGGCERVMLDALESLLLAT